MKRKLSLLLVMLLAAAMPAAAQYSFGGEPLDDVILWADEKLVEYGIADLTANELAAVMLAPVYPETGAGTRGAPSPMTMSRWDYRSALLWAFGDPESTYRRAFFHPGIGMWQFDSAGLGAPASADFFIGSYTAAYAAADEMARRWRNSTGTPQERRDYVWRPWNACRSGICETIFNILYDPTTDTLNVARDENVTRYGGAVWRVCAYASAPEEIFDCLEVDPTVAEGVRSSWQQQPHVGNPVSGPSPLTLLYYVFTESGEERRHWLAQLTEYDIHISVARPLGRNARTSNVWYDSSELCVDGVCY